MNKQCKEVIVIKNPLKLNQALIEFLENHEAKCKCQNFTLDDLVQEFYSDINHGFKGLARKLVNEIIQIDSPVVVHTKGVLCYFIEERLKMSFKEEYFNFNDLLRSIYDLARNPLFESIVKNKFEIEDSLVTLVVSDLVIQLHHYLK